MKIYTGLEAQPEFPQADLTDRNANALELLLANNLIVTQGHEAADGAEWAFKVGHPAVIQGGRRVLDLDGERVAAVEHGVMTFEAMTVAVAGLNVSRDILAVNQGAMTVCGAREGNNSRRMLGILEEFRSQMPRAAEVITASSARLVGPLTDYALLGASLERYITLSEATLDYGEE